MPRDRRAVIGTGLWSEATIRRLTRRQQHAYLLAYTRSDLSRCGVLAYKPRPWAALSADGDEASLREDFQALHDTRHVILDDTEEELLIRTYVRHDGLLTQPLVVAAMVRDFFTISSTTIRHAFLAEIRRLFDVPLEDKEHTGLALAIGADPATLDVRNASQVAKAIGKGLAGAMVDAISEGYVQPFTAKGLPKGLTEGLREGLTKGPPEGQPDPRPDPQGQENARIPVPVTVPTPIPVPVPAPTDDPAGTLLAEHAAAYTTPPPPSALTPVRNAINNLVAQHTDPNLIRAGLAKMRERSLSARLLPELVAEVTPNRDSLNRRPPPSRNGQILDAAMQRARDAEAAQPPDRKAIG